MHSVMQFVVMDRIIFAMTNVAESDPSPPPTPLLKRSDVSKDLQKILDKYKGWKFTINAFCQEWRTNKQGKKGKTTRKSNYAEKCQINQFNALSNADSRSLASISYTLDTSESTLTAQTTTSQLPTPTPTQSAIDAHEESLMQRTSIATQMVIETNATSISSDKLDMCAKYDI